MNVMKNRTTKTVSLLAFVAAATALLYRPTLRLVQRISARRKEQEEAAPGPGEFAAHYRGANRHHSRNGKHHAAR